MAKKKEKVTDLKGYSLPELRKQASALSEDLFGLKLQNVSGQLENTAKIRTIRKQIARVKSMISHKVAQK